MITIESCSARGVVKTEETELSVVAVMIAEMALENGALYVEMKDGEQELVRVAEHVKYPAAFA